MQQWLDFRRQFNSNNVLVGLSHGKTQGQRPESHQSYTIDWFVQFFSGLLLLFFRQLFLFRILSNLYQDFLSNVIYILTDDVLKSISFKNNLAFRHESKIPQFLPQIFVYITDLIWFELLQITKVYIYRNIFWSYFSRNSPPPPLFVYVVYGCHLAIFIL